MNVLFYLSLILIGVVWYHGRPKTKIDRWAEEIEKDAYNRSELDL